MTAASPPARNNVRKNGTGKHKPIEGPFEPKLLAQAKELAGSYHVVLESRGGSGLVGTSLEMPTVFAKGATADACVIATRQALTIAIASMLEAGAQPPRPYVEQRRAEQMNIRLDAREKMLLKQAAARHGFRSASDYVRVVALKDAQN